MRKAEESRRERVCSSPITGWMLKLLKAQDERRRRAVAPIARKPIAKRSLMLGSSVRGHGEAQADHAGDGERAAQRGDGSGVKSNI